MLTWDEMAGGHPRGHLLTGYHGDDGIDRIRLLCRLIEAIGMSGAYAIRQKQDGDVHLVQALFEMQADAKLVGQALHARPGGGCPGWASQWSFLFDARVAERIRTVLASDQGEA